MSAVAESIFEKIAGTHYKPCMCCLEGTLTRYTELDTVKRGRREMLIPQTMLRCNRCGIDELADWRCMQANRQAYIDHCLTE